MLAWLDISIKDIIDILLLAVFLYYAFTTMRYSGSRSLFMGIIAFLGIWLLISQVLQMRLMGALLDKFINIGFIILVIIFQDEIRRSSSPSAPPSAGVRSAASSVRARRRSRRKRTISHPSCWRV